MRDNIRHFFCVTIPSTVCNFKCAYCCGVNNSRNIPIFSHSPAEFRKALSRERMAGACMFNFTALGETLLCSTLVDYVRGILEEGHFVEVVTNASLSVPIKTFSKLPPNLLSHLMLKCSFHYKQLKSRNLLNIFARNVNCFRDAGGSVTIELMPTDDLLPLRNEIYDFSIINFGAPCHLTVGRDSTRKDLPILTNLGKLDFEKSWSIFDSELFRFKLSVFNIKQRSFCYAGKWMSLLYFDTGDVSQCYRGLRTINIYRENPLVFKAIGANCREPHCYNAHAWLTFGCIPSLQTPYYDEVRNRKCTDGSEWLQPEFKNFCHQKFNESNAEYSEAEKRKIEFEMRLRKTYADCIDTAAALKHAFMR